jgi:hypothetical protein
MASTKRSNYMQQTAIVSILEPRTYSLDARSLAWTLTSGLKANSSPFAVTDGSGNPVAQFQGIAPLLQIVPVVAGGQSAFLYFMKGVLSVTLDRDPAFLMNVPNMSYSLINAKGVSLGSAHLVAATQQSPPQITLLSTNFGPLDAQDITALQAFGGNLTATAWSSEPIVGTTHNLYLATNGQLLNRHELLSTGVAAAELVVDAGMTKLISGMRVPHISYRKVWAGAGVVNAVSRTQAMAAASSSCGFPTDGFSSGSDGSSSSAGTSFGGGGGS